MKEKKDDRVSRAVRPVGQSRFLATVGRRARPVTRETPWRVRAAAGPWLFHWFTGTVSGWPPSSGSWASLPATVSELTFLFLWDQPDRDLSVRA